MDFFHFDELNCGDGCDCDYDVDDDADLAAYSNCYGRVQMDGQMSAIPDDEYDYLDDDNDYYDYYDDDGCDHYASDDDRSPSVEYVVPFVDGNR